MRDIGIWSLLGLGLLLFSSLSAQGFVPGPHPEERTVFALDASAKVVLKERRAEVFRVGKDGQEGTRWSGNLLNIPAKLFVAPSGSCLVTVNRWHGRGADPLIFYDSQGKVVKRYSSAEKELLNAKELSRVGRDTKSIDWSAGARLSFTAEGQYFLVWLPWGRMMIFDPLSGRQIDADRLRLAVHGRRAIVLETIKVLSRSKSHSDRIDAARFAGWLGGSAVAPILRRLARDPYYVDGFWRQVKDEHGRFGDNYFRAHTRQYPVRRAAAEEMHIRFGQAEAVIEEVITR